MVGAGTLVPALGKEGRSEKQVPLPFLVYFGSFAHSYSCLEDTPCVVGFSE